MISCERQSRKSRRANLSLELRGDGVHQSSSLSTSMPSRRGTVVLRPRPARQQSHSQLRRRCGPILLSSCRRQERYFSASCRQQRQPEPDRLKPEVSNSPARFASSTIATLFTAWQARYNRRLALERWPEPSGRIAICPPPVAGPSPSVPRWSFAAPRPRCTTG